VERPPKATTEGLVHRALLIWPSLSCTEELLPLEHCPDSSLGEAIEIQGICNLLTPAGRQGRSKKRAGKDPEADQGGQRSSKREEATDQ